MLGQQGVEHVGHGAATEAPPDRGVRVGVHVGEHRTDPEADGQSWWGSWACRAYGGSSPRASYTWSRRMREAGLVSDQPAPGPRPAVTSPASRSGPRALRTRAGLLARLAATRSEVSDGYPRRAASSSQHRAWIAVVRRELPDMARV